MSQKIGYYLDALSEWQNTPDGSTIIGNEKSTTFQDPINNAGRLYGFSAALNAQGAELWEKIKEEVNPTAILDAAFIPGQGNSSVLKNRGDSSKWFYAQNFQITSADTGGPSAKTNKVYAGVAAVLWSFNQLYPSIPCIPVFDSYYVKSLGSYDASEIQKLLLPIFDLTLNPPQQQQWNFLSTLYRNQLIDGFIGDIYTIGQEGKFPVDSKPFDVSIPYALQSIWANLPAEGGQIETVYDGDIPVSGSIYFPGDVPDKFDGSAYLKPIEMPIPGTTSLTPIQNPYPESTNHVERLYNLALDSHLLTSNENEIDILTGGDWVNEGTFFSAPDQATAEVFRFYIASENRHFYTALESERDIIIGDQATFSGWDYEGSAFSAYSTNDFPADAVAVVRYLNEESGNHVYSTSTFEQGILDQDINWFNEGIAWYGDPMDIGDGVF